MCSHAFFVLLDIKNIGFFFSGLVGVLIASDYDDPSNGPPFTYKIDENADQNIKEWFNVNRINNGSFMLEALTQFDRERKKQYSIPIQVCDLKDMCQVSNLKLTIGDVNDNPMSPGFSEIFVYSYQGLLDFFFYVLVLKYHWS